MESPEVGGKPRLKTICTHVAEFFPTNSELRFDLYSISFQSMNLIPDVGETTLFPIKSYLQIVGASSTMTATPLVDNLLNKKRGRA
jgi:hypothetical protein